MLYLYLILTGVQLIFLIGAYVGSDNKDNIWEGICIISLISILFPIFWLILGYSFTNLSKKITLYFDIKNLVNKNRFEIYEYLESKNTNRIHDLINTIKGLESYNSYKKDHTFSFKTELGYKFKIKFHGSYINIIKE